MHIVVALFWIVAFWVMLSMLATIPAWLLWNSLVPPLFGLSRITMFQAFGLLILARLFFNSRSEIKFSSD